MGSKRIDSERKERAVILYQEGLSKHTVAKTLHMSNNAVVRALKEKGLSLRSPSEAGKLGWNLGHWNNRKPRKDGHNWDDLKELYIDKQLSVSEIAKIKGCDTGTVAYQLQKRSIPTRTISEGLYIWNKKHPRPKGSDAYMWKGGRCKPHDGYIRVYCPDHPNKSDSSSGK